MLVVATLFSLIFLLACVYAMYSDITRFEIPNTLSILLAAAYLPYALSLDIELAIIGRHYIIGFATLAVGFLLFVLGVIGGGDSKFVAAVVIWLEAGDLLSYLFFTTVFGGFLAIIVVLFRLINLPPRWMDSPTIAKLHDKNSGLPYALAIGGAGLVFFPKILLNF